MISGNGKQIQGYNLTDLKSELAPNAVDEIGVFCLFSLPFHFAVARDPCISTFH